MANNPDYLPPLSDIPVGDDKNKQAPPAPNSPTSPVPPPTPPPAPAAPTEPPAPANIGDVDIRTMSGDIGSSEPNKTFKPADILGNEPVFNPQKEATPTEPQLPPQGEDKGAHNKALIISIAAVAGLVVLGGLAYFFFLRNTPEAIPPVPPPVEPTPIEPTPPPVEPTPPPAPTFIHDSFFPESASVPALQVSLSEITSEEIKTAIGGVFAETETSLIREINLTFNEMFVDAWQFLRAFMPTTSQALVELKAEQDFTLFAYRDRNGIWPGFVLKLKPEDPPSTSKSELFSLVEQNSKNFYLNNPGAATATAFKVGAKPSANFRDVRYLPYTQAGASFNIGWVQLNGENYMLVSTSFAGFKEAATRLGF